MTLSFPLGSGPEFDRIRGIARALGNIAAPLGDDCALVRVGDETLAISTDVSTEGVHFKTEWLTLTDIGWRATAGALSDLAAEGATPIGLVVALSVPSTANDEDVASLMGGVGAAASASQAMVLGGDLSSGPCWSIAVTVIGRAPLPVTRTGALPGDQLWVTGALGGARAALEAFQRGEAPSPTAREAFAKPVPRIVAGGWLARHGARAMLDLSDGIGGDAAHLAAASSVVLDIELDRLPLAPDVPRAAARLGISPAQFAAEGGEDYELLVAMPAEFGAADAARCASECGVPLTAVGLVQMGSGVRFHLAGRPIVLAGFDHFRTASRP